MQEDSLLELLIMTQDSVRNTLQWWASISFGLIALGHFAAEKLKRPVVILLCCLYTLFTAFIFDHLTWLIWYLRGPNEELLALQDSGQLSIAGQSFVNASGLFGLGTIPIFLGCAIGTFFGTLWYLIHSYRKAQAKQSAQSQ